MLLSAAQLEQVHITNGIEKKLTCLHSGSNQTIVSFLEGPKAALIASKDFENGHYKTTAQFGIRAFARVYCAWAYGQTVQTSVNLALS